MLANFQKKAQQLVTDNITTILTAGGVIGTVTTAVLTARATFQAAELIRDAEHEASMEESKNADHPLVIEFTTAQKAKVVWLLYIPPVISGSATIGSIIMANRMSAQQAAALAAAYGMSQKQRDEYKAKLEEKLGLKKSDEARTEMYKQRTDETEAKTEMIIVSGGAVLCYDNFSDRYIRTTAEKIRQAEKKCKEMVQFGSECSLEEFYTQLGFDKVPFGEMLGWNLNNPPNITVDTILVNDEPCLCIDFVNLPFAEYKTDY